MSTGSSSEKIVKENGDLVSPFSFLQSPFSPIKQFTFQGKPFGKKFCLQEKDTIVFLDMMNKAYRLGKGLRIDSEDDDGSDMPQSFSTSQGLSIHVCDKIKTAEVVGG
jgi:hypothetical protein